MPASLTNNQVWTVIEKQMFAVLGTITPKGQPRTSGIVYKVRDKKLYIGLKPSKVPITPERGLAIVNSGSDFPFSEQYSIHAE